MSYSSLPNTGSFNFSIGDFLKQFDIENLFFISLFVIFFTIFYFVLMRVKLFNKSKGATSVLAFLFSLTSIYFLNQMDLNIDYFIYNLGFSTDLLYPILGLLLFIGTIMIIKKFKTRFFLIGGAILILISFTGLHHDAGIVSMIGFFLVILGIVGTLFKKRSKRRKNMSYEEKQDEKDRKKQKWENRKAKLKQGMADWKETREGKKSDRKMERQWREWDRNKFLTRISERNDSQIKRDYQHLLRKYKHFPYIISEIKRIFGNHYRNIQSKNRENVIAERKREIEKENRKKIEEEAKRKKDEKWNSSMSNIKKSGRGIGKEIEERNRKLEEEKQKEEAEQRKIEDDRNKKFAYWTNQERDYFINRLNNLDNSKTGKREKIKLYRSLLEKYKEFKRIKRDIKEIFGNHYRNIQSKEREKKRIEKQNEMENAKKRMKEIEQETKKELKYKEKMRLKDEEARKRKAEEEIIKSFYKKGMRRGVGRTSETEQGRKRIKRNSGRFVKRKVIERYIKNYGIEAARKRFKV